MRKIWWLALCCGALAQAGEVEPSVALVWKKIPIADVRTTVARQEESHKDGPREFQLSKSELTAYVTGISIYNQNLVIGDVGVELKYSKVIAKNVVITGIPQIKFSGPGPAIKLEEKRFETTIGFDNPSIRLRKTNPDAWGVPLPESVKLEYRRDKTGLTSIVIQDREALVKELEKSIDATFSDNFFEVNTELELVNLPGVIEFLLKLKFAGDKPQLYEWLRNVLKKEVAKAEFIDNVERSFTRQMPVVPIPLESKLDGLWTLKTNDDGLMSLRFGSDVAMNRLTRTWAPELYIAVANGEGMNLIVGLLLEALSKVDPKILGRGYGIDTASGLLTYDDGSADMAKIASELAQEQMDRADGIILGIDLRGTRLKREVYIQEGSMRVRLGLVVSSSKVAEKAVPTDWVFKANAQGHLQLDRIDIVSGGRLPAAFALFQKVDGSFKTNMARFVLNDNLTQIHGVGRAKFSFPQLTKEEAGIRVSLSPPQK